MRLYTMARISPKILTSTHPTLHLAHPSLESFIWNTLIRSHGQAVVSSYSPALVYLRMRWHGVAPDLLTFPFLLQSLDERSHLKTGQQVHTQALLFGFYHDPFVQSSLIGMYSTCGGNVRLARRVFDEIDAPDLASWNSILNSYIKAGLVGLARKLFDEMPDRNVITWSSLINGYVKFGKQKEALGLFREMQMLKQRPNAFTLSAVLSGCGHLGELEQGRFVHSYVERFNVEIDAVLGTALIDMYVKCGKIDSAKMVFHALGLKRDVKAYSAMISGLAMHGHAEETLRLFEEMNNRGIKPNPVTFLGVLCACAHGGLVNQGKNFFKIMQSDFGMTPSIQHYGCMVDLYGRAGLIDEAWDLISSMPMEPDVLVWGALLSGSRTHRRTQACEIALQKLIELDPLNTSAYILLSNAYAKMGQWNEARRVRDLMEARGVKKVPGCSVVEIGGQTHEFFAGDDSRPGGRSREIYAVLEGIMKMVEHQEYASNTKEDLVDADR